MIVLAVALVFALIGGLYWPEIRKALTGYCSHGIAHDSYCVQCKSRR